MIRTSRLVFWAVLSAAMLASCSERQQAEPAQADSAAPKNLLLICLDTVRADMYYQIAALGGDRLGAWEKKALVYTNAQAPAPWTVPTLGSVFTGLLPAHHGAGLFPGAYGLMGKKPPSPMRDLPTIADAALGAGYDTAVVSASSWTNGNIGLKNLMGGFSEFTAFETPGGEADWRPVVSTWVENDLKRAEGRNFLHFLHFMEAHNWHANFDEDMERIFAGLTEQQLKDYGAMVPSQICQDPDSKFCRSFYVYAHAIRELRDGVAEILDTLQRQDLLEDTVVVVFSDHGEEFLDHFGDQRKGDSDSVQKALFEAFGHGKSLYQEMINVPLLVWHPDYAGATIDAPVSLTDIAPSVIRWTGLEQDLVDWQGEYLGDVVTGNQKPGRTIIGSALSSGEQQISALHDNKKAIWFLVSDHIDYYDLATDPGEKNPIDDDKLVLAFDGMFLDYMQDIPKKEVEKSSKLTDEQIRRLQSIGYLQGVDTGSEPEEADASQ